MKKFNPINSLIFLIFVLVSCSEKRENLVTDQVVIPETVATPAPILNENLPPEVRHIPEVNLPPVITLPRPQLINPENLDSNSNKKLDTFSQIKPQISFLSLGEVEPIFRFLNTMGSTRNFASDGLIHKQSLITSSMILTTIFAESSLSKPLQNILINYLVTKLKQDYVRDNESLSQIEKNYVSLFLDLEEKDWGESQKIHFGRKLKRLHAQFPQNEIFSKLLVNAVLSFDLWPQLALTPQKLESLLGQNDVDNFLRLRIYLGRDSLRVSQLKNICFKDNLSFATDSLLFAQVCALAINDLNTEKKYLDMVNTRSIAEKRSFFSYDKYFLIADSYLHHLENEDKYLEAYDFIKFIYPLEYGQSLAVYHQAQILAQSGDLDNLEVFLFQTLSHYSQDIRQVLTADLLPFRAVIALKRRDSLALSILSERYIKLKNYSATPSWAHSYLLALKVYRQVNGENVPGESKEDNLNIIKSMAHIDELAQVIRFFRRHGLENEANVLSTGNQFVTSPTTSYAIVAQKLFAPDLEGLAAVENNENLSENPFLNYIRDKKLSPIYIRKVVYQERVLFYQESLEDLTSDSNFKKYISSFR